MYIGLTNNLERRVREHQVTFKDYFEVHILKAGLSRGEASKLETELIDEYRLTYKCKLLNKANKGIAPTGVSGSEHPQSKLTLDSVLKLRTLWVTSKGTLKLKDLAQQFNVSTTCIHNVLNNKSYIDPNYTPPKTPSTRLSKLSFEDILHLRTEYKNNKPTLKSLGAQYGITGAYVGRLIAGKALPHAPGPIKGKDY